jgi:hypothetical protein
MVAWKGAGANSKSSQLAIKKFGDDESKAGL